MKYILLLLVLFPSFAMAAPSVKMEIQAEKLVVVEENGKQVTKRVPANDVTPGDILAYTLIYKNDGDEGALNVNLDDPIPSGTKYVVGSAYGPGSKITYSIDGGKTYNEPSLLSYEIVVSGKKITQKATPDQYTHIRWTIKNIEAGKSGSAGFQVKVK